MQSNSPEDILAVWATGAGFGEIDEDGDVGFDFDFSGFA